MVFKKIYTESESTSMCYGWRIKNQVLPGIRSLQTATKQAANMQER